MRAKSSWTATRGTKSQKTLQLPKAAPPPQPCNTRWAIKTQNESFNFVEIEVKKIIIKWWRAICGNLRGAISVCHCAEVYMSHGRVMAGFILQHLSEPTFLHNPLPLSQHAVTSPPPGLSAHEFIYICAHLLFWSQNVPGTEYATSLKHLMCLPLSLPALLLSWPQPVFLSSLPCCISLIYSNSGSWCPVLASLTWTQTYLVDRYSPREAPLWQSCVSSNSPQMLCGIWNICIKVNSKSIIFHSLILYEPQAIQWYSKIHVKFILKIALRPLLVCVCVCVCVFCGTRVSASLHAALGIQASVTHAMWSVHTHTHTHIMHERKLDNPTGLQQNVGSYCMPGRQITQN